MSSQPGPGGVLEALAVLARYLADDGGRQRFAANADDALAEAGVPASAIPAQTLQALKDCSEDQLAAFSSIGSSLENEGMAVDVPGGFGRVFFF